MRSRVRIVSVAFIVAFIALIARLFFWQVIRGKALSAEARGQYQVGRTIVASRGNILARDGTWLVASGEAWLTYAALDEINEKPQKIADQLAPFFVGEGDVEGEYIRSLLDEANRLKSLLTKEGVSWVPLKHKVPPDTKSNIEALSIGGIGFEFEETRAYPESSTAAHLLGFVGKNFEGEDTGYFGLEGYYDLTLTGKPGYVGRESDARGIPILLGGSREISAIGGVDLLTHIDKTVQLVLDRKLTLALEKYGASGATAIVMEPETGAILGMSSHPSYDPAKYYQFGDEFFKNPAVSDSFEPGSIFKVIIMSAALDAGVVKPETKCEICDGPLKVDKYIIRTWDNEYHPDLTMSDVIVLSDNVGMAWVAQKLGADTLYDYLDAFGIGRLSGIDLQGESAPKLREKGTWNIVDLPTAGFGQGVAITPIQMIRAVSAVANGGMLPTPQVVDKLIADGWQNDIKPEVDLRVISKKTASKVTAMMVEAAKSGEARWTHLRGFKVAGKTGTAQIPIAGHYDEEKTIASFVGFVPADDPKFIMLVTLREPESSPWASETAAPLWYSIAKDLFLYFGIQPEN